MNPLISHQENLHSHPSYNGLHGVKIGNDEVDDADAGTAAVVVVVVVVGRANFVSALGWCE